jgi:uncharacterized membrane protein YhaH (DUF805 family)
MAQHKKIKLKKRSQSSARIHKGLSMPVGPGGSSAVSFRNFADLKAKYFSFRGRIQRRPFILRMLILIFVQVFFSMILYSRFVEAILIGKMEYAILFAIIFFVLLIPVLWSMCSLGTRRCHDINKSGALFIIPFGCYMFSYIAPVMGWDIGATAFQSITAVSFLGLFTVRGTPGDNAYGPERMR